MFIIKILIYKNKKIIVYHDIFNKHQNHIHNAIRILVLEYDIYHI